jgi:hypothetical protein
LKSGSLNLPEPSGPFSRHPFLCDIWKYIQHYSKYFILLTRLYNVRENCLHDNEYMGQEVEDTSRPNLEHYPVICRLPIKKKLSKG